MSQKNSILEGAISKKAQNIKQILDDNLNKDKLEKRGELTNEVIKLFQQLFVESLNFDPTTGIGSIAEQISINNWSKSSKAKSAYIIAEAYNFRVLYIELEKLTKTTERSAVKSMRARDWAEEGEYIVIFYAEDSAVWHLVSPYMEEEESQAVLRRYVIGEGETHRTVSRNLALMDVDRPEPLFDRVQKAFKLRPVEKKFYEEYKSEYEKLYEFSKSEGLEIKQAKKYAHLTLNRLMFIYFLQKKGWLPQGKNFMDWYVKKYQRSSDEGCFHEKWLNTLFFEAMRTTKDHTIDKKIPLEIKETLESFPYFNGGLFEEKEDIDNTSVCFKDEHLINDIIESFLETYNFTVTEETPLDKNVAVDPAMLGKIYESLIAEEERGKSGIFYTPRDEVDLMCKLSLYEHLMNKADEPGEEGRKEIIRFLFTPLEDYDVKEHEDVEGLMKLLHKVKVVDPACGSGAFLVGMMQVFNDLYRKLGEKPDYKFREQIVQENLYGVDIKDWAVRMAEFRLWLALVEDEDELPPVEPVLPNFDFKLKTGDSIVQKIGDESISLDKIMKNAGAKIEDEKKELEKLKKKHYKGDTDLEKEIKDKQKDLIKEYFKTKIQNLEEKKEGGQVNLSGEITEEEQQNKKEIEAEIEEIKDNLDKVDKIDERGLFVWGVDFPEVMLEGGFDVVIANPPYVRQEKIIRQNIDPEQKKEFSKEKIKELKKKYKDDLVSYVKETYDIKVGKRSDLYIYFFFKGLELLNSEGSFVFISSNSWLDVKYGKYLQEFLCKYVPIKGIYNNKSQRSFEEADVNTVITVLGAPQFGKKNFGEKHTIGNVWPAVKNDAKFITFNEPYQEAVDKKKMIELEKNNNYDKQIQLDRLSFEIYSTQSHRSVRINQGDLLEDGWNYPENFDGKAFKKGKYLANKWGGKFLRAPNIYFTVMRKGADKLSELGNLAEVKFGIKTGANKFFYVHDVTDNLKITKNGISNYSEKLDKLDKEKYRIIRSDLNEEDYFVVEEKYLRDVARSPRELDKYRVENNELEYRLFYPDEDVKKSDYAFDYIKFGESENQHEKSTTSSRNPWYGLPDQEISENLCMMSMNDRHPFWKNGEVLADARLYTINSHKGDLSNSLNTTLTPLMIELYGRGNLGQGALDFKVYETEMIQTIIPEILPDKFIIEERKVRSVFEEIGLDKDKPFHEQEPEPLPDRKKLDDIVFDELGLTEKERKEVYRAVAELVRARLEKAESV